MRAYHIVSGLIFALIAVMHLARIINHWPMAVGTQLYPMSTSWATVVIAGFLSIWSFRLLRRA